MELYHAIQKYFDIHLDSSDQGVYLRGFGISKGGTLEINFSSDYFSAVLLDDSKYGKEYIPYLLCCPNQIDYPDRSIINSDNRNFTFNYTKSKLVIPLIVSCIHVDLNFSYRYTNPINVDNNLLILPFCLFSFMIIHIILMVYYYNYFPNILLALSAAIKSLSLFIFSLIWLNQWTIENCCKYVEHIYPIGNAISTALLIISFYDYRDKDFRNWFNIFVHSVLCIFRNYFYYYSITANDPWLYDAAYAADVAIHILCTMDCQIVINIIFGQFVYLYFVNHIIRFITQNYILSSFIIYEIMHLFWHIVIMLRPRENNDYLSLNDNQC